MSSGSYVPGPVSAMEIPKDHGAGLGILGEPNTADRVAQTAAPLMLEERSQPIFHQSSYGYLPGVPPVMRWLRPKALLEAGLDRRPGHRALIDSVPHDPLLQAVAHH